MSKDARQAGFKPEGTIIQQCICDHEDQDKLYGKSMRVKNRCYSKITKSASGRCTVCGKDNY